MATDGISFAGNPDLIEWLEGRGDRSRTQESAGMRARTVSQRPCQGRSPPVRRGTESGTEDLILKEDARRRPSAGTPIRVDGRSRPARERQ